MTTESYRFTERYPSRRQPGAGFFLAAGLVLGATLPAVVYVASGGTQPCRHDMRCALYPAGETEIEQAPGPWRYLSASNAPAALESRLVCYSGRRVQP